MADGFSATVDDAALLAMFDRLGPSIEFHCREVGRDTAKRIVSEAQGRVRRATGQTAKGIHWELSQDDKGYVVLGYRKGEQAPVDRFLELGTATMLKRPFFWASMEVEAAGHRRRLEEALQAALTELGR